MPAIVTFYGTKKWYKDDKLHRDNDKPAVITADGTMYYYTNGILTNVIDIDGNTEVWDNGEFIESKSIKNWKSEQTIRQKISDDLDSENNDNSDEEDVDYLDDYDDLDNPDDHIHQHDDIEGDGDEDYDAAYEEFIEQQDNIKHRHNIAYRIKYNEDHVSFYKYGLLHRNNDLPAVMKNQLYQPVH